MKRNYLLAAAVAVGLLTVVPTASAYSDYCGYYLDAGQRCDDLTGFSNTKQTHSATTENRGRYTGSGSSGVCERIEYGYGGGTALLSRICGSSSGGSNANWITSGSSSYSFSTVYIGNGDPYGHTINGRVNYN